MSETDLPDSTFNVEATEDLPREDDARSRLIAAAGPVFARHGFDRATVREICREAGTNIASVGYYFGDKFGLYRAVIRHIRRHCQSAHPEPEGSGCSPRQRLHLLISHMLSQMLAGDDSGWESQLMMREMNHPTGVFTEIVEESFRPGFELLKRTIAELSPPDVKQDVLEKLALSVVGQCLYYRVGSGVVRQLLPPERLRTSFTSDALALHITAVIIAAAEDGLSSRCIEQLRASQVTPTCPPCSGFADSGSRDGTHSPEVDE